MIPIKNIMLVDDCRIDLFINQRIIERYNENIRVIYFKNPLSALKYLNVSLHPNNLNHLTRPNVLILDVNMPECNGFQFLDKLSKLDFLESQNLKIFMLSSSTSLIDINQAESHPLCSGYINKPLTVEKLHKAFGLHANSLNKKASIK
ncbi:MULTISPECIES: response regulator [Hwangdonia]|uniref:Response regulator n=1 Tax=Hwangdonia seohaensis TaxID=1240727 RepID=A0ABW3R7Q5_9FLAO|nr:response regulator [Hwangdonia seohaensis]